jgi:type II secretory pathway component PulF
MNYEALAFANHQLAGMLKSGIPLEGALRRLSGEMRRGRFRDELRQLEQDLARGMPLDRALADRRLPEFYVRMMRLGAQGDDLPGVLLLLADHYQQAHRVWSRLKGLMVYPVIVLLGSLGVAALIAFLITTLFGEATGLFEEVFSGAANREVTRMVVWMWTPAVGLALLTVAILIALALPPIRRRLRWWLPGFREAALSGVASTLGLILERGGTLHDAIELTAQLEAGSPAGRELERWKSRQAEGHSRFTELAAGARVFPPLFIWLVGQGGEDLANGFRRASEVYHGRAMYRSELMLYFALPMSVLFLGMMLIGQFYPVMRLLTMQIDMLGGGL